MKHYHDKYYYYMLCHVLLSGRHVLHEDVGLLHDVVEELLVLVILDVYAQGLLV